MTAPALTVCPTCKGDRVQPLLVTPELAEALGPAALNIQARFPCLSCCCATCGQPTKTPPLCERHQREQDDEKERP